MSDWVQIQAGQPPWLPTPETEMVEVVNEYDAPLLSVVRQHGTDYMVRCIFGEVRRLNVWVYARLDEHERNTLVNGTADESDEMAVYLTRSEVTAAIAKDDQVFFSVRVNARDVPEADLLHWLLDAIDHAARAAADDAATLNAGVPAVI